MRNVGASDLEYLAPVRLVVEGREEVAEHIVDRNWLGTRGHPAGRDHHRQPFDKGAEDFERRAPRADHDRGTKLVVGTPDSPEMRPTSCPRRGAQTDPPHRGRRGRRSAARLRHRSPPEGRSRLAIFVCEELPDPIEWTR